jgi:hypothetical protein
MYKISQSCVDAIFIYSTSIYGFPIPFIDELSMVLNHLAAVLDFLLLLGHKTSWLILISLVDLFSWLGLISPCNPMQP